MQEGGDERLQSKSSIFNKTILRAIISTWLLDQRYFLFIVYGYQLSVH